MAEARQVPEFGNDARRVNQLDPAAGLQRRHYRLPAPVDELLLDRLREPLHPRGRLVDRLDVLLEGDALRGVGSLSRAIQRRCASVHAVLPA